MYNTSWTYNPLAVTKVTSSSDGSAAGTTNGELFPVAAKAIKVDTYTNDVITGPDADEADSDPPKWRLVSGKQILTQEEYLQQTLLIIISGGRDQIA